MEEDDIRERIKLGAFVAGGMVLFLIAVFFIGRASNFFNKTFVVSAIFKNVDGLKGGDKVWLSGVQIGVVKSVTIVHVGKVAVELSLREKQNEFIRKNASASIGSDGLIGNRIVVIQPGDSPDIIQEDDTLTAVSPADTQELINVAMEVGENTKSASFDLKTISGKIRNGQGLIGELLNEGALAKDVRQTVANLKTSGENLAKASSEINYVAQEIKQGKGLVPALLSDTSYVSTFSQAISNIKKVSINAARVSKSLEDITNKMNNSNNAVGTLLADTAVAHQIKTIIKNSELASYKLDENMEALKHNFLTRGYFKKLEKEKKKAKK
jgi:phospholipid/cholesterol/gamma-HCH transport system substrate-binding protein